MMILVETNRPALLYKGRPIARPHAVIPRIGASITFFGLAVLRQFEQMGVFCLNEVQGIARSRDKLRALQILSRHEIGIPPTAFARRREDIVPAIECIGGVPCIIKVLEGTQGIGVILAESMKNAEAVIETLHGARQNILIQRFIAESRGTDIRAFVVGDKVVAAMRRVAQADEFRSNVHRGASVEAVELDPKYRRAAVLAAKIFNLNVAGVDILESAQGPMIMEVNSSPGLQGIETATGIDVAGKVVEWLERRRRLTHRDFRLEEMLRLRESYGVVSFPLAKLPQYWKKRIEDTDFADRRIRILAIRRGELTIPAPSGRTPLYRDDVLVCYGNIPLIEDMLPATPVYRERRLEKKRKKRRRPAESGA
jgi:ribosomal protein S6--L-glutamate ligase